jgi:hypothetical protein
MTVEYVPITIVFGVRRAARLLAADAGSNRNLMPVGCFAGGRVGDVK